MKEIIIEIVALVLSAFIFALFITQLGDGLSILSVMYVSIVIWLFLDGLSLIIKYLFSKLIKNKAWQL